MMGGHRGTKGLFVPTLWLVVVDTVLLVIATFAAIALRQAAPGFADEGRDVDQLVHPIAVGLIPLWIAMIAMASAYERRWLGSGPEEFKRILNTSLIVAGLLGVTTYLFAYPLSRGFYIFLFLIGIPLLLLGRYIMRRVLHAALRSGRYNTSVLIAGELSHIEDLLKVIQRNAWLGYRPVGLLMRTGVGDVGPGGLTVYGRPCDAVHAIEESMADAVIFAEGSFSRAHDFNHLARDLEDVDAQTIVVPALTDIASSRMTVRPVAGIPLVHVERPTAARATAWTKRAFDILGASVAILLFWPLMLAVAMAIKLDDGGPILFRQVRVGARGEQFECLKFRSMVVNAEELKAQLMAFNESDGALFKMENDPRITRVGRFIRRYSLDEFPQFFNVLFGDMSLVGPRPALPSEVQTYKTHVLRRLDVRPGITGLWQVSGRSDLDWDETVRLDLYYVDNWSMLQDIVILLRTVRVVLAGSGAY